MLRQKLLQFRLLHFALVVKFCGVTITLLNLFESSRKSPYGSQRSSSERLTGLVEKMIYKQW